MIVTTLIHFVNNISHYINNAVKGEKVEIIINDNKKLKLELIYEEK